jgi:hypothetical protein
MPSQLLASQLATLQYQEEELLLHVTSDMPVVTQGVPAAAGGNVGGKEHRGCKLTSTSSSTRDQRDGTASGGFPAPEQIAAMVLQLL